MGSNGIFMVRMITIIYYNEIIIWDQDDVYCLLVMIYIYHYIHLCKTFAIYHLFWEITIMSLMIHLGFMEQTHLGVIMFILATGNRLRTPVTWFYDIS